MKPFPSDRFSQRALSFYNKFVNLLVIFTLPIVVLTLIISILIILYDLRLFSAYIVEGELRLEHEEAFKLLIKNILNFFVLIELFRVFLDVIEYRKIRMRQMLEAGVVFVVREIVVAMFEHRSQYTDLIGYAVLLLALGITFMLMEKRKESTAVIRRLSGRRKPISKEIKEFYKSMDFRKVER
jgi:uncharacterized membrane protein (DUF373 family)